MAKIKLNKKYEVTFIKDGAKVKKGQTVKASLPVISRWVKDGKCEMPADAKADLDAATKTATAATGKTKK